MLEQLVKFGYAPFTVSDGLSGVVNVAGSGLYDTLLEQVEKL
jgi:hypothetical protein